MTSSPFTRRIKRPVAASIATALVLQALVPTAYAQVSQVPGIYIAPPRPNVVFTLDDSGSMTSDVIPDFGTNVNGMPTDNNSAALSGFGSRFPGMWRTGSAYLTSTYYRSDNQFARYLRSPAGNPLYYDPLVTYSPWPQQSNNTANHANADPTRVVIHHSDPFSTAPNGLIDLTRRINTTGNSTDPDNQTRNFWPGTYYVYTGSTPLPPASPTTSLNVVGSFTKYEIKSATDTPTFPRASSRTDCTGTVGPTGCTYAQELQNFANWLQYYRSRMLMAKGGAAIAFARQATNLRAGFTTVNTTGGLAQTVGTFTGTQRTNFFNNLYNEPANGSTPLRRAADTVGRYFLGNTAQGNPWSEVPSTAPGSGDSCRKSFHILSTDGFWNDANTDISAAAQGNHDTYSGDTPSFAAGGAGTYSDAGVFAINPFRDGASNTLADVAAYYWKSDLQTSTAMTNRVAPTPRDPAHWQHVTTFTVGLGVSGSGQARPSTGSMSVQNASGQYVVSPAIDSASPFFPYINKPWLSDPALRDLLVTQRTPMTWPTPTSESVATGDDLIHASMVGRGRYFSATNPTELATGLQSALAEATNQISSFASLGLANTVETSTSNRIYQAVYNPMGWTGRVYSFRFTGSSNQIVTTAGTEIWEASRALPSPNNRNIFTWNPEAATPQGSLFTWSGLNGTQQAALGPTAGVGSSVAERQDVLDYLRGSAAREVQNAGPLRDRVRDSATAGPLGDVVGGSPVLGPSYGGDYSNLPAGTARDQYRLFRGADPSGTNSPVRMLIRTLFFGANDGMLHAVNAVDEPTDPYYVASQSGAERFAYVPNSVFNVPRTYYNGTTSAVKKLYEMSRPDYGHLFTVNAPPQLADAYIRPQVGNPTGWKTLLLGATGAGSRSIYALDVTNPTVGASDTEFNTSKILWEFGETQSADMGHIPSYPNVGLMRNGAWVALIGNGYDSSTGRAKLFLINLDTGAIEWEQAVGAAGGNGLSQPNFLLNDQREVVAIYAGDLRGNMWKFDVSDPNKNQWHVAFGGNPLFTTPANQPITVMPELEEIGSSSDLMVVFGTGKLLTLQDNSTVLADNVNLNTQAIYGIRDTGTRVTALTQLVPRTITGVNNGFGLVEGADINWATQRGWYFNLTGFRAGERVNVNPLIPVRGRGVPVFVVANSPSNEPCSFGGAARVFALDSLIGKSSPFAVFDTNRDGSINSADSRHSVMPITAGILSSLRFLTALPSASISEAKAGTRGQTGALEGGFERRRSGGGAGEVCVGGSGMGRMIGGISDTSGLTERVQLALCPPRISWRQIK